MSSTTTNHLTNNPSHDQQEHSDKPFLSFSIENILKKGPFDSSPIARVPVQSRITIHHSKTTPDQNLVLNESTKDSIFVRLPWLSYTRYCPPKIPRTKPRKGKRQHKLDRNPRIPFSPAQLAALEAKFVQSHYLSSSEVRQLSTVLSVTEHRVKIWFQNRRAREKKNTGLVGTSFLAQ